MKHRIVVIIPARFDASRLPGKPLLDLGGKPMIRHVYERACQARVETVWVATDDARIFDAVQAFGGRVVMTSPDHYSGTDRVAEVARGLEADIVVNVQGDEPLLDPTLIEAVAMPLVRDARLVMATVAHPVAVMGSADRPAIQDPNRVKVVCDRQGNALYFSRLPIPFEGHHPRHASDTPTPPPVFLQHLGLYAYRADFLQTFTRLSPTPLEQRERLEQLRALEHGHRIRVVIAPEEVAGGVDTPADVERVRRVLAQQQDVPPGALKTPPGVLTAFAEEAPPEPKKTPRVSERLPANTRGVIRVEGQEDAWVVQILNLGLEGFGILSDRSLQEGTTVFMEVTAGVLVGTAVCRVVFCRTRNVAVSKRLSLSPEGADLEEPTAPPGQTHQASHTNGRGFHVGLSILAQT